MKKSFATSLLLAAAAALSVPAMAQTTLKHQKGGVTYEMGTGFYNETYEEKIDGNKVMQEKAEMLVIYGSMRHGLTPHLSTSVRAEVAFGDSEYTGAYQGGQYGDVKIADIGRSRVEVKGLLHYHPKNMGGVDFHGGVGYRHLNDNLHGAPGGYKRINELMYLQLGADKTFQLNKDWAITPAVAYKHVLRGNQFSAVENGLDFKQKGHGLDFSLKIAKKLAGQSAITIEPYLRAWSIKKSDSREGVYGTYFEPENTTKEVGINVGWRF